MPDPAAGARAGARTRTTVLVLNGPNLNLLGRREPEVYGTETLDDVERVAREAAAPYALDVELRQSNHEGELIDWVHRAREEHTAVVINPGGYTHTSVALRDALAACDRLPVLEVHISNIHRREEFRHHSYVSAVADGVIAGCGVQGYALAVQRAAALIEAGRA